MNVRNSLPVMTKYRVVITSLVISLLTIMLAPVSLETATLQAAGQPAIADTGPWLLFRAIPEGGTLPYLWGINADGTGLTQLSAQPVLNFAVHPYPQPDTNSRLVAYIGTSPDDLHQDVTLYLLSLPDGEISTLTPLTSDETGYLPGEDSSLRSDPAGKGDILVGLDHRQGLTWSPDGQWLAFVGAMDGPSVDLYSYELATGTIRRLTDEPDHTYQLLWTVDSSQIIHSTKSCFLCAGGPYGRSSGILGATPDGAEVVMYEETEGTRFVTWRDATHLLMDSGPQNGCMGNDRILDIARQSIEPVGAGCFFEVAYDDAGRYALLAAGIKNDLLREGLGMYLVDIDAREATWLGEDWANNVWWDRYEQRFLIYDWDDQSYFSVTVDGTLTPVDSPTTQALSPDRRFSAWFDLIYQEDRDGELWMQIGDAEPVKMLDSGGIGLAWSPDSRSIFYDSGSSGLYLVVAESLEVIELSSHPPYLENWHSPRFKWQATWVAN